MPRRRRGDASGGADPRARRWLAPPLGVLAAALALAACTTPSAPPTGSPFEPLASLSVRVPDAADRAARDVAAAVLADDRTTLEDALERLEAIEAERRAEGEKSTGLLPQAIDARNATLADVRERRQATRALLGRRDVGPELRARLREEVEDDPLRLAKQRLRDARVRRYGRIANTLMEPAGRSMVSSVLFPYRMGSALLNAWLAHRAEDVLTPPERQALDHWKRFIDQHPDAPEAAELLATVESAQLRWLRTQRDRNLREARRALRAGEDRLAVALAGRALRYAPEDGEATVLLHQAQALAEGERGRREATLEAAATPRAGDPAQRELAVALLLAGADVAGAAEALHTEAGETFAGEAAFASAVVALEEGQESAAWRALDALAARGDAHTPMARHARAMGSSPLQNPYRAFRSARGRTTAKRLRWLAFGPLHDGARERDLPRAAEWLVEVPTLLPVVMGLPNRLIRAPFMRAESKAPSVLAHRYLERFPDGERAAEVRAWLASFERRRGNHVGALKLLEAAPAAGEKQLATLRGKAAEQALEASQRERRRDVRYQLLRQVAREFQGTEAGQHAGELVREELHRATPQQIRVSRGFLLENPRVAGPEGLGLRPELLDGDPRNGELHPEGVTLLGGRAIEVAYLAPSGRKSHPPERVRRRVSEERLARVVAQLEEAMLHTARVDRDASVEPDPDRDTFFERVRLGLADQLDVRPHAESSYTFLGMRERYGLVRSRESILPVEIVLQGSFNDFGLGAFPRIRMPKATPDAFLYR
jgi:hypothetical protein